MGWIGVRLPVAAQCDGAIGADSQHRATGDGADTFVARRADVGRLIEQQPLCDALFQQRAWHLWQRPQAFDLRGKGEEALPLVIEDMALAHVVAPQRQRFLIAVPDSEGEVADQVLDAVCAPFLAGREQKRAVRHIGQRRDADRQRLSKFLSIVEPQIGNERQTGIMERLSVESVLARNAHHQMAEADRSGAPCPRPLGTEMRKPRYLTI